MKATDTYPKAFAMCSEEGEIATMTVIVFQFTPVSAPQNIIS